MISVELRNVSDTKITVTDTATSLYSLMDTASSDTNAQKFYDGQNTDSVMILPENGDIRFLINDDPTATNGDFLSSGTKYYIPRIELFGMRLIRTGSANVSVTVVPYRAEKAESPVAVATSINLGASALSVGTDPFLDEDVDNTAQALKTSTGNLYRINVENTTSSNVFFSLFDEAAGSVVVGTTVPVLRWKINPNTNLFVDFNGPLTFTTAITYALTSTRTGSGAPITGGILNAEFK